jgi:hypothetical protein
VAAGDALDELMEAQTQICLTSGNLARLPSIGVPAHLLSDDAAASSSLAGGGAASASSRGCSSAAAAGASKTVALTALHCAVAAVTLDPSNFLHWLVLGQVLAQAASYATNPAAVSVTVKQQNMGVKDVFARAVELAVAAGPSTDEDRRADAFAGLGHAMANGESIALVPPPGPAAARPLTMTRREVFLESLRISGFVNVEAFVGVGLTLAAPDERVQLRSGAPLASKRDCFLASLRIRPTPNAWLQLALTLEAAKEVVNVPSTRGGT